METKDSRRLAVDIENVKNKNTRKDVENVYEYTTELLLSFVILQNGKCQRIECSQ